MATCHLLQDFSVMGRKKCAIPNRNIHSSSGLERIVWNGKSIYLGKPGSPEADAKYKSIVKSILDTGEPFPPKNGVAVEFLADRFLVHTKVSFPQTSREPDAYRRSMDLMKASIGCFEADSITPAKFIAMRDEWVSRGLGVRTVNKHHNHAVACFRWGVTVDLVKAATWHALTAVQRLRLIRSKAKEPRIVKPVEWKDIEAIKDAVRPQLWAMIQVQWHTGMRSGEMMSMTPAQIDKEWVYRPMRHKNAWRRQERSIYLGPQCREVLRLWIQGRGPEELVFPGYHAGSYCRAITRACQLKSIPHWHPHQIRHAYATRVRGAKGIEAAMLSLGHSSPKTTDIYAERSKDLIRSIAEEIG